MLKLALASAAGALGLDKVLGVVTMAMTEVIVVILEVMEGAELLRLVEIWVDADAVAAAVAVMVTEDLKMELTAIPVNQVVAGGALAGREGVTTVESDEGSSVQCRRSRCVNRRSTPATRTSTGSGAIFSTRI